MKVEYYITDDNKIGKVGQLDSKIFAEGFQDNTLNVMFEECPTFISWVQLIFDSELKKLPENSFADGFGTWFINKIGEKGVDDTLMYARTFESNYEDKLLKAIPAFNALIEFLVCDWKVEEKQFTETRRVRRIIESTAKKLYKKAKKIKDTAPDHLEQLARKALELKEKKEDSDDE